MRLILLDPTSFKSEILNYFLNSRILGVVGLVEIFGSLRVS